MKITYGDLFSVMAGMAAGLFVWAFFLGGKGAWLPIPLLVTAIVAVAIHRKPW